MVRNEKLILLNIFREEDKVSVSGGQQVRIFS